MVIPNFRKTKGEEMWGCWRAGETSEHLLSKLWARITNKLGKHPTRMLHTNPPGNTEEGRDRSGHSGGGRQP